MKNGTRIAELTKLQQQQNVHNTGIEAIELGQRRVAYAALYQRLLDLMQLDEEGFEVSITLRGLTKTVALSAAEAKMCFDNSPLYADLTEALNKRHAVIIGTLLKVECGTPLDSEDGADNGARGGALALCLPPPPTPPANPEDVLKIAEVAASLGIAQGDTAGFVSAVLRAIPFLPGNREKGAQAA